MEVGGPVVRAEEAALAAVAVAEVKSPGGGPVASAGIEMPGGGPVAPAGMEKPGGGPWAKARRLRRRGMSSGWRYDSDDA